MCLCVTPLTYIRISFSPTIDPNLKTKGEGLTPLHLAARYQPHSSADTQLPDRQSRVRGSIVSLTDAKQEQPSSSKQAVEFLKERMAEVRITTLP